MMQITAPQDRKAIGEWGKGNADPDQQKVVEASLASLSQGDAWFWSPAWLQLLERVHVRKARTFDSSATPKPGELRREAKVLAAVDLDRLKEGMERVVADADARDPAKLQAQIRDLRRELAAARAATPVPAVERVEVHVPYVPAEAITRLHVTGNSLASLAGEINDAQNVLAATLREFEELARSEPVGAGQPSGARPTAPSTGVTAAASSAGTADRRARSVSTAPASPSMATSTRPSSVPGKVPAVPADPDLKLKAGARRILETLARHHPMRVTKAQLGTLAKFKITGGTFGTYWSTIKRHGLIDDSDGLIGLTDAGLAYVGHVPRSPMTTDELLEQWRDVLKAGARAMLDVLVAAYPQPISRNELAARVQMEPSGGTFGTYLGTLRRNGLITVNGGDVTASETLFLQ